MRQRGALVGAAGEVATAGASARREHERRRARREEQRYRGRPHLRVEGGLFAPRVEQLRIGSRDGTRLVDGVLTQVDVVRGLLDADLPVHGVLCFVDADWPLLGGDFGIRGVRVLWPRKLRALLRTPGDLPTDTIDTIHRTLARGLPRSWTRDPTPHAGHEACTHSVPQHRGPPIPHDVDGVGGG
ncbi:hypothetical protein G7075_11710 [Phycicoccus sp. HDW14]|uniref:hypothetical protein n=1 Tax=Phycicoccus sp. HDW14 TaxID=2714941 RepID=UPI0014096F1A|nr:hypothetical protein [Phycicoccus sp. HDW14]QIM21638.1 hypothetical protein G7075_11710 [Phycicoccus sp. HDW14]